MLQEAEGIDTKTERQHDYNDVQQVSNGLMDRRRFLTLLGTAVASVASTSILTGCLWLDRKGTEMQKTYAFFTPAEVAFMEAAVSRLIPQDELGPGALEADVPYFIDQQLSGRYGEGARYYNQGPYGDDTGYQGYQFAFNPRQLYRAAITATDEYCKGRYDNTFAGLDPATQDTVLQGLQGVSEDVKLKEVPGTAFFSHLLADTKDGFFADPIYGGNKDKAGWKLIGFPGVAANYKDFIGKNAPYNAEPVSIADIKYSKVPVDEHGHPIHE